MFWRRAIAAVGALALLAAASWLPARASGSPPADRLAAADLARPTLKAPQSWPTQPAGPVEAVSAFLWSLSTAVGGNAGYPSASAQASSAQAAPATPAPVRDSAAAPFARAYAYLAPEWRANLPFATFLRTWDAVRHLDPLGIIAVGPPPGGDPRTVRVFVEVRILAARPGEPADIALSFADGFYVTTPSPQGWHLSSGSLHLEDFGLLPGSGASPGPESAAAQAARAAAARLGRPTAGPEKVLLEVRPDHQTLATVRLGEDAYTVRIYQLADGQWVALSAQR